MSTESLIPIGEIIRELRQKRGLTQTQLAERTGLDSRTITAIEKGRIINPSLLNLKKMAAVFQTTLHDLIGRAEAQLPNEFYVGSQKGEFLLDYSKHRFRIVSYLPKNFPFFTGKLVLESKGKLDPSIIKFRGSVFLQIVLGRLEFTLQGKEMFLKEGQTCFFDGRLSYSLHNPTLRETTAYLVTVPSFLTAD